MALQIREEQAKILLEQHYDTAAKLLEDDQIIFQLIRALEAKIITISLEENSLTQVPLMVSFIKEYALKNYPDASHETIQSIVSAMIYFLSTNDMIFDSVPELGYVDDAAVIGYCYKVNEKELLQFKRWKAL